MPAVEDTGTKRMFITHYGTQKINWKTKKIFQYSYEISEIIMKILPIISPIITIFVH